MIAQETANRQQSGLFYGSQCMWKRIETTDVSVVARVVDEKASLIDARI